MIMRNKILALTALLSLILLVFIIRSEGIIKEADACLCTEILSNDSFLDNKNKMPSVKNCIDTFENFENAHLRCIKSFKFDHPQIKKDSLKAT
jgi:hypothetical protein